MICLFVAQHEQKYRLKEEKKLYMDGSIVSMRTQIIIFFLCFGRTLYFHVSVVNHREKENIAIDMITVTSVFVL